MNCVQDIVRKKPYLAWYVKDKAQLSDSAVLEHVLNYGSWEDVQKYIQLKGIKATSDIFREARSKKRSNYLPEIENFFSLYFKKHA